MDEIRAAIWGAIRGQWPDHVEAVQAEAGNIRVSYLLGDDPRRPHRRSRFVSIWLTEGAIAEMRDGTSEERAVLAGAAAKAVARAMETYDAHDEDLVAMRIELDERALGR
jgi:hypothetical protein